MLPKNKTRLCHRRTQRKELRRQTKHYAPEHNVPRAKYYPWTTLSYFTFQEPPLSGTSLSIIPSAFSFARCFSIAFAVTPISAARPAAVNLPFSERRAMIFSLLLPVFLLPFEVFSLLSSDSSTDLKQVST